MSVFYHQLLRLKSFNNLSFININFINDECKFFINLTI